MTEELQDALEVLARTDSSIEGRLELKEGMSVFEGHFPNLPILPGVVQLNLVEQLAARWAGRPLRIGAIPKMKFTVPLRPGDAVLVRVDLKPREEGLAAAFVLEKASDGAALPASRGRVDFFYK